MSEKLHIFNSDVEKAVLDQNRFRTSWAENDTEQKITAMYWQEHEEYLLAKQLCALGADPSEFASEAGDKGYLYIKLLDIAKSVPDEITQDILSTYQDCQELGIDFIQAIFFKVWRNDMKYPLMISRNGFGPDVSTDLSKRQYKMMGGEPAFLYAYMMLADELGH